MCLHTLHAQTLIHPDIYAFNLSGVLGHFSNILELKHTKKLKVLEDTLALRVRK